MKNPACPRTYRGLLAGVMLAAAWLLPASTTLANNPVVTTTADSGPGSLRWAIANAPYYGTITFDPKVTGTITLTSGELGIIIDLTIIGPGANILTISGNNTGRVFNIAASATVTISGLTISSGENQGANSNSGDAGDGEGGGIINSGILTLANCTVSQNQVLGGQGANYGGNGMGGGIYSSGALTLINCLISFNSADGGSGTAEFTAPVGLGGGIYSQGALAMTNCTVGWNAASGGGDIGEDFTFGGFGDGGGLYVLQAGLFANCTIANNSAYGGEGVSTFPGNYVTAGYGEGGGLYIDNTNQIEGVSLTVILTSCTISGNFCSGGGLNTEIAGTPGAAYGGGIFAGSDSDYAPSVAPTLNNTIISGNEVVGGYGAGGPSGVTNGPDVYGGVASGGFNLVGEADGSSGWNGADQLGTTSQALNPQLGQLQDNGGPTLTMALPSSSPAIDKGYSFGLATDQRGSPRPADYLGQPYPTGGNGSDIGAFELHRPVLYIAALTNSLLSLINVVWNETDYYPPANAVGSGSGRATFNLFGITPTVNTASPMFGVEVSPGLASGHWMGFAPPVRKVNGNVFVARDSFAPIGAIYQLSTAVTNTFIPPAATTAATAISSNAATLNGTTTPYGFDTAYWFEYGADTNYGTCTFTNLSLATSTNLAALSCAIGGLAPSSAYHFQLVVTDDDGIQLGGDQSFMTLSNAPATPPPTVVSYAASSVGTNTATLNGSVNGNGLPVGAWFEYGTNTSYGSSTYNNQFFTSSDYYAAQAYSTPITGLTPNTTYHYQAIASSMAGQGSDADTTFTTAPLPPTVATLAASSVTHGGATLNGMVNANGSSSTVYFQYGTTTSYGYTTTPTAVNSAENFSAPITGLSPNITYHFQIVATNRGGTS